MTLREIQERVNQGPFPYKDVGLLEFISKPCSAFPEETLLFGKMFAQNPFCTDAHFGGCFLSTVTECDCATLDKVLLEYKRKMGLAERLANKAPIELHRIHQDSAEIQFASPAAERIFNYQEIKREGMFFLYVMYRGENDYSFNQPVIINGKTYQPIYSFWLDSAYYKL